MDPISHPSNNCVMRAPKGVTHCVDITVTLGQVDGVNACVSYWQPTQDELELLARGRPIALVFLSPVFPPVMIGVDIEAENWRVQ